MDCIFDPVCEMLPPWTKELYLCIVAPLLYLLSDLLPYTCTPFPMYSICRQCLTLVDGGVKYSLDHILQEFYILFLTRFRTYTIATPPQTKMTRKDDIKRLVSLKFLCPWLFLCCKWVTKVIEIRTRFFLIIISASKLATLSSESKAMWASTKLPESFFCFQH